MDSRTFSGGGRMHNLVARVRSALRASQHIRLLLSESPCSTRPGKQHERARPLRVRKGLACRSPRVARMRREDKVPSLFPQMYAFQTLRHVVPDVVPCSGELATRWRACEMAITATPHVGPWKWNQLRQCVVVVRTR